MTGKLPFDPAELQTATEAGREAIKRLREKGIRVHGMLDGQLVEWLPDGKVRLLRKALQPEE